MDIGEVKRIIKVKPEPYPLGKPEQAPKEPAPMTVPEPVEVPA